MTYQAARQMDLFECGLDRPEKPPFDIEHLPGAVAADWHGHRMLIDEQSGLHLNDPTRCAICGRNHALHRHHVFFGTANRKISDEDCMVVYLCPDCHEDGARAVHRNREMDVAIKQAAERVWMADRDADEDAFRSRYGRSWL